VPSRLFEPLDDIELQKET
jgi:hypothetical protein